MEPIEEQVRAAFSAALDAERAKALEESRDASLIALVGRVTNNSIWREWIPRLFPPPTGDPVRLINYTRLSETLKRLREEVKCAEPVELLPAVPVEALPEVIQNALTRGSDAISAALGGLAEALASSVHSIRVESRADYDSRIAAHESEAAKRHAEIGQEAAEHLAAIETLQSQRDGLQDEITSLQENLQRLHDHVTAAETRRVAAVEDLSAERARANNASAELAGVAAKLAATEERHVDTAAQLEFERRRSGQLGADIASIRERLAAAEECGAATAVELAAERTRTSDLSAALAEARENLAIAQERLSSSLDAVATEKARSEKLAAELQETRERLAACAERENSALAALEREKHKAERPALHTSPVGQAKKGQGRGK